MLSTLFNPTTWIPVVVLAGLWLIEGLIPFYAHFRGGWRDRLQHDGRNIALGLGNKVIVVVAFATLFGLAETWAGEHRIGLLRLTDWPVWGEAILVFLLLDLWTYIWHRLNHVVPFLWRFHRVHHTDHEMDASSAVRFHTGEVVMSATLRLGVITLIGANLWQVVIYDAVFLPIVLFHHSNIRLPRWLDRALLVCIVTPAMHRVHHSRWRPQTNANYSSVLPWWDMIFRTFRVRRDAHVIQLGLHGCDDAKHQRFTGMLATPFYRDQALEHYPGTASTHEDRCD